MWKRINVGLIILFVFSFILVACGGGEKAMSPEELIVASAAHMNELEGFEFSLSYDGEPVAMDAAGLTTFTSATGQYNAPEDVSATVKASAANMVVETSLISTDGAQWITNPLTGSWTEVTGEFALQPAKILDGQTGLFAKIADGVTDITEIGEEELEEAPGLNLTHLQGMLSGEMLSEVSGGMIDTGALTVDLWVDATTFDLHRVQVTDEMGGVWVLDIWNFGSTFDIQPPQ